MQTFLANLLGARQDSLSPLPCTGLMAGLGLFEVFNIRESNPSKAQTNKCITGLKG